MLYRYWILANLENGEVTSFKMSGVGKVDLMCFSQAANSTHLHGINPYAETTAEYPMWEEQAQSSIAKRPGVFKKRIDELVKAGSNELPAANAQRASFQLHYRLKDGCSFGQAMDALIAP